MLIDNDTLAPISSTTEVAPVLGDRLIWTGVLLCGIISVTLYCSWLFSVHQAYLSLRMIMLARIGMLILGIADLLILRHLIWGFWSFGVSREGIICCSLIRQKLVRWDDVQNVHRISKSRKKQHLLISLDRSRLRIRQSLTCSRLHYHRLAIALWRSGIELRRDFHIAPNDYENNLIQQKPQSVELSGSCFCTIEAILAYLIPVVGIALGYFFYNTIFTHTLIPPYFGPLPVLVLILPLVAKKVIHTPIKITVTEKGICAIQVFCKISLDWQNIKATGESGSFLWISGGRIGKVIWLPKVPHTFEQAQVLAQTAYALAEHGVSYALPYNVSSKLKNEKSPLHYPHRIYTLLTDYVRRSRKKERDFNSYINEQTPDITVKLQVARNLMSLPLLISFVCSVLCFWLDPLAIVGVWLGPKEKDIIVISDLLVLRVLSVAVISAYLAWLFSTKRIKHMLRYMEDHFLWLQQSNRFFLNKTHRKVFSALTAVMVLTLTISLSSVYYISPSSIKHTSIVPGQSWQANLNQIVSANTMERRDLVLTYNYHVIKLSNGRLIWLGNYNRVMNKRSTLKTAINTIRDKSHLRLVIQRISL